MGEYEIILPEWASEMEKRLYENVRKKLFDWCTIVTNLGLKEENRKLWITSYEEQVDFLLDELNKDALMNQEKLLKTIENLLKEAAALCKELRIKIPEYGSQKLGLVDEQNLLIQKVNEYKETVQNRRKELEGLERQMKNLCSTLGQQPKPILTSPLPSEEYITQYREYIVKLEEEEYKRQEKYADLKTEIIRLAKELKYQPNLDFEKMVVSEENDNFEVTDENMEKLSHFHKYLEEQFEHTKQDVANLHMKVKGLWEILEEDRDKCAEFLQKYSGYSFYRSLPVRNLSV